MQSLIIVLREGIEAALAVAIIFTYLNTFKREDLKKNVYFGVGTAVLLSIITAIVFKAIQFDADNEYLEGSMYLISGILVLTLIIWMAKSSKNIKNQINSKLEGIVNKGSGQAFGVFLFTAFMVYREGIETVIFIFTLSQGSTPFSNVVGAIFGIILAVAFTYLFIKGSSSINISKLFKFLNVILVILVVRLFAGAIHEFGEKQLIPLTPAVADILGYLVKDNSLIIISIVLITIPMLMMIFTKNKKEDLSLLSGVEKRIKIAEINKNRNIKISATVLILVINTLLGYQYYQSATKKVIDPNPIKVEAVNDEIKIPVKTLGQDLLNKYSYKTEDGTVIRFMLIKRADDTIGFGMDGCQVCGTKKGGYYQEDGDTESIICKNCSAPITISTVGMPGGCNPMPLSGEIKDGQINIKLKDLLVHKQNF